MWKNPGLLDSQNDSPCTLYCKLDDLFYPMSNAVRTAAVEKAKGWSKVKKLVFDCLTLGGAAYQVDTVTPDYGVGY